MAVSPAAPARGVRRAPVPARFMQPRVILVAVVAVLVAFGLLMVYSASSVKALQATGDAAYYLKRQALTAAAGVAAAVVLARVDYHVWCHTLLIPAWVGTTVLLVLTAVMGVATKGAVRWIEIAGVGIQPSEFAKVTVVLTAANLLQHRYEDRDLAQGPFLGLLALGVGLPLLLILLQPDKGTTAILGATLLVMAALGGMPLRVVWGVLALGGAGMLALALRDSYSLSRILTMLDPSADPYGAGYQLIQGFYAFANGGLLGVGVGLSRQKYSYLPEAHNDFIFAIIGEECGLVGTLAVVALFALLVWTGMRVARYAPDVSGRLVAAGCTTLIGFQFLVNACGVLGIIPMSGKPMPFLSYGGSSILTCLMLVGLVLSVSRASALPETVHDRRRGALGVAPAPAPRSPAGGGEGYDGGVARAPRARGLTLVSGGAPGRRERIDLGGDAYERLRPSRPSGAGRPGGPSSRPGGRR